MLEQRSQGTVGEARGQDGVGAGASLTSEERAGDLAARVQPFFEFHLEWEKVNAFAYAAHGGGREDERVVERDGHRAARLGGQFTGLERDGARPNGG